MIEQPETKLLDEGGATVDKTRTIEIYAEAGAIVTVVCPCTCQEQPARITVTPADVARGDP